MSTPPFRSIVEPYATIWRWLVTQAHQRGLVHAMEAFDRFPRGHAYFPSDVGDLVADMVDAGVLEPVAVDLAGAPYGHSLRAFRGVGPSAGGQPSKTWSRAEAYLWTYREGAPS